MRPVTEMAFGVSLDSIRRFAREKSRISGALGAEMLCVGEAVCHAQASGRARANAA